MVNPEDGTMDTHTASSARKATIVGLVVAAILVFGFGASIALADATDQPQFCMNACHEMKPYGAAHSGGAHKDVACVDCHVDQGLVPRMAHKIVALKEVQSHFFGEPTFPMARTEMEPIPNERCIRCHEKIVIDTTGFDHNKHASGRECASCHQDAGHSVTTTALATAGILNAANARIAEASRTAASGDGTASVPGHIAVPCSSCHDMAQTGCGTCHKPKHASRGSITCDTCHKPGVAFVFSHPQSTECGTCHKPPAEHRGGQCGDCHTQAGKNWTFEHAAKDNCDSCHKPPANHRSGECQTCHKNGGVTWAFTHPNSANCTSCHNVPGGHRSGSCTTCHQAGVSWAFRHPNSASCTSCHNRPSGHRAGSCASCHRNVGRSWAFTHPKSSSCASCHNRPSGHRSGSCTTCHKAGASWRFSHPGSGAKCLSCHSAPGGHRTSSCSSCHRTGVNWAFRHPSSTSCSSCHKAPSGHYGSTCSSCHSPSRAWSSATFSHPRVPGGEHTYRSFACSKCHPSGPPRVYCSCHNGNPPDD